MMRYSLQYKHASNEVCIFEREDFTLNESHVYKRVCMSTCLMNTR
jgi:hypothetical protein